MPITKKKTNKYCPSSNKKETIIPGLCNEDILSDSYTSDYAKFGNNSYLPYDNNLTINKYMEEVEKKTYGQLIGRTPFNIDGKIGRENYKYDYRFDKTCPESYCKIGDHCFSVGDPRLPRDYKRDPDTSKCVKKY